MKSLKIITSTILLLFIFSCQKDDDQSNINSNPNTNSDPFTENFGNVINRDFLGQVIDQNDNPIENVTITIGSATTQTDANGVFIIRDASIYERFGYIKAEKIGYIHGSRSVVPTSGTNKVTIMLLEETIVGTTTSGTSETIALSSGASVTLEGDYIKEDGSSYSGSVNVIMHHLDPTDENMPNQMPGMLYAANANNEERMLQTFGMLAVELRGSNGEDLNLATGTTAEITVPLDASLLATAPATIPLWYFDEAAGYWKEEGEATLIGSNYVGTVSHFSFWNCDVPAEAVSLCITVTDEDGTPLSSMGIFLNSENYGSTYGNTCSVGYACGLVPLDETLDVNIFNAVLCGTNIIYTSTIGPFTEDSTTTIIIPNSIETVSETIFGNFYTCENTPVTEGYVVLVDENSNTGNYYDSVDDGTFELSTIRCNTTPNVFKIKAYDYVNTQETDTLSFTYTTPLTNLGTINACNSVEEFITYEVDGGESVTYIFGVQCWLDGPNYLYAGYSMQGSNNNFSIYLGSNNSPLSVGTYNNSDELLLQFRDDNYFSDPNGVSTMIELNLSSLGEVSEYIDMNFIGTFIDVNTNIEHSISGTIHAIRDF